MLCAVLYSIFLALPSTNFILSAGTSDTSPMMYFLREFNYLEADVLNGNLRIIFFLQVDFKAES